MNKAGLLTAVGAALGAGRSAAPEQAGALAGLAHTKKVVAEAADAGLVGATDDATARARRTESAGRVAEKAEQAVKQAADDSTTSAFWLRRVSRSLIDPTLDQMWDTFSSRDVVRLIAEMTRRAVEGKGVVHHLPAGALREMVAKNLSGVRRIVDPERARILGLASSGHHLGFLDTGAIGDVFLPTRMLKGGGRSVELGTDRVIGIARGAPQEVTFEMPDGGTFVVTVQGELEVTVAIEVKGRSVVAGGLRQVEALRLEGRGTRELADGTSGGYAVIDGRFWLLRYDPATVRHVVVAPRGPDFDAVEAVSRLTGGGRLMTVEIPLALDNQVLRMAGALMSDLKADLTAWKAAVSPGTQAP